MFAYARSIPPWGGRSVAPKIITALKPTHFAKQPAAAWHCFIASVGIPSWGQQSCSGVATSSVPWFALSISFEKAAAPAAGTTASESAMRRLNMVRPMRIGIPGIRPEISDWSLGRSSDESARLWPSLLHNLLDALQQIGGIERL